MPEVPTLDALTPDLAACEALREAASPGPVVMLNLLRFREPDGRARFAEYGAISGPLLQKVGGEPLYMGEAGPVVAGTEAWDSVILIRFENIDRSLELVSDATYQTEGRRLREAALERTLWMVTYPPGSRS